MAHENAEQIMNMYIVKDKNIEVPWKCNVIYSSSEKVYQFTMYYFLYSVKYVIIIHSFIYFGWRTKKKNILQLNIGPRQAPLPPLNLSLLYFL